MTRRAFAAAACALTTALSLAAAPISDPRKSYRIGIAALEEKGLDPLQAVFASTIPLRVRAELLSVRERRMSAVEKAAYRENARLQALYASGKVLEGRNEERAKILFSEDSDRKKREGLVAADKMIEAGIKEISANEAFEGDRIAVEERKPIEIAEAEGSLLFSAAPRLPATEAALNDLDLLISGSITALEDYMVVELWAYHRYLGEEIYAWKMAVAPDDTDSALEGAAQAIVALVSAEASASLLVNADPESADIYVDGAYRGRGWARIRMIPPGEHVVRTAGPGYAAEERTVTLAEGEALEISMSLGKSSLPPLKISTSPDGAASVYLGAEYLGPAPAEVPAVDGVVSGRARMPGMEDSVFAAQGLSAESLQLVLEPESPDGKSPLEKAREKFYVSNAFLLLALPFTFVSVGMVISAVSTWDEAASGLDEGRYTQDEFARAESSMMRTVIIAGPIAAGFSGLTAWFLTDSIIRLGRYLKAARN
jgi:hypothetical protein